MVHEPVKHTVSFSGCPLTVLLWHLPGGTMGKYQKNLRRGIIFELQTLKKGVQTTHECTRRVGRWYRGHCNKSHEWWGSHLWDFALSTYIRLAF